MTTITSHIANAPDASMAKQFPPSAPDAITVQTKQNICEKEHLKQNAISPNQNGCYDFDRVLKSGELLKRTKKTKSWKPVYLVLRPNVLSMYKDRENTKLRHQVPLYDLTAIARQRDPKHKMNHIFGIFSPSRNFHLSAQSEAEAQSWVDKIRREARLDEEDEEMILVSPTATRELAAPFGIRDHAGTASSSEDPDSVSPRFAHRRKRSATLDTQAMHSARRPSNAIQNYSGNEAGSYSDFSDPGALGSVTSFTTPAANARMGPAADSNAIYGTPKRPAMKRGQSHMSTLGGMSPPEDRVVCQGWLQLLKSHRGVRQWRSVWAVLRPKTFATYKNEDEYSALLVISFSNLVDAVEIDPLSKTKTQCFQLIAEERTYRFCAASEGDLDKWLGGFKSLLAKRRLSGGLGAVGAVAALSLGPAAQNDGTVPEQGRASGSGRNP